MTGRFFRLFLFGSVVLFVSVVFLHTLEPRKRPSVQSSGVLRLAFEAPVQSFDPRIIGSDPNSQYIEELRFLPLISFDPDGNIKPVLAKTITALSNRSWRIHMRDDLTFASGLPITANDVVATYQAILNPPFGFPASPRRSAFRNVVRFDAISPTEIDIVLNSPDASFLTNLVIGTLPKQAALQAPPNDVNDKHYESGPFTLVSASSTSLLLEKNASCGLSPSPTVHSIRFQIIPDANTRYAALLRGDLDIVQNALDPDKLFELETHHADRFHVFRSPRIAVTYLGLNFRDPLLKDRRVRQALNEAVNMDDILKYRMRSDERRAASLFPPNHFYFNPAIPVPAFDTQKAQNLLREAGYRLPVPLSIQVSSSSKNMVEAAKILAAQLNMAGFSVHLEALEYSIFQDRVRRGRAQVWVGSWVGFKDPDHLRFIFGSDMVPPHGGNRGAYVSPALDVLLQQGRQEIDPAKRRDIYAKAQEIVAHDVPYIFLWHGSNEAVVSNDVQQFQMYADGRYGFLTTVTKK